MQSVCTDIIIISDKILPADLSDKDRIHLTQKSDVCFKVRKLCVCVCVTAW